MQCKASILPHLDSPKWNCSHEWFAQERFVPSLKTYRKQEQFNTSCQSVDHISKWRGDSLGVLSGSNNDYAIALRTCLSSHPLLYNNELRHYHKYPYPTLVSYLPRYLNIPQLSFKIYKKSKQVSQSIYLSPSVYKLYPGISTYPLLRIGISLHTQTHKKSAITKH